MAKPGVTLIRMTRRRTFLRTTGVATLGGLTSIAGCLGEADNSSTPTTTAAEQTTNTEGNETTTEEEPNQSDKDNRFFLGNTSVIDDFEDLEPWEAMNGEVQADSESTFQGSQAMRITAPESDGFAWAGRDVDWDLSDKTLSMAVNVRSPVDNVIMVVRLLAPDTNNMRVMGELLRARDGQSWMRLDLATRDFAGAPDLANVSRVEVGMRAAAGEVDFTVDDLRSVPRPDKGSVILSFDDSLEAHYSEAFKKMQEYEMPGNVGVITGQVGSDGSLSIEQMEEMREAGWELASHGTRDQALTSISTQQMWLAINDASDWLARKGFSDGNESFVYPHGEFNDEIVNFVRRKHAMGFRYMDPLSATSGRITDPLTIGRGNAAYNLDLSKTVVNFAEQFNVNAVLTFHDIKDNGGLSMSPSDFSELIDYLARRDVEVITFSDLKKNHFAD